MSIHDNDGKARTNMTAQSQKFTEKEEIGVTDRKKD
jgi:hypothetical protein